MANGRKVEIYHLIDNEANYPIMFRSYEWAQRKGIKITRKLYQKVYTCERQRNYSLEAIFQEFNLHHPADYQAHSLSVSDVVVITQDGITTAYYCNDFGFEELPEFFKAKRKRDYRWGLFSDYGMKLLNFTADTKKEAQKIFREMGYTKDSEAWIDKVPVDAKGRFD